MIGEWTGGDPRTPGVVGVVGAAARVMSCRAINDNNIYFNSDVTVCFNRALALNLHFVINFSGFGQAPAVDPAMSTAVQNICNSGGLVVVCAGNGVPVPGMAGRQGINVAGGWHYLVLQMLWRGIKNMRC